MQPIAINEGSRQTALVTAARAFIESPDGVPAMRAGLTNPHAPGVVITAFVVAWGFSPEERAAIADGANLVCAMFAETPEDYRQTCLAVEGVRS